MVIILLSGVSHIEIIDQWFALRDQPIAKSKRASPIRLVNAVIIPAPKDFEF